MSGVCDSTSPVKAKVIASVGITDVVVDADATAPEVTVADDVAPEVVAVAQPVVMQANTKINRPRFTQPIYCSAITAVCACYRGLLAMNSTMMLASSSPLFSCKK